MPDVLQPLDNDALAAARASGAPAREPVRFRLAEALARRASAHAGAARRVLDDKLARLVDALCRPNEATPPAAPATTRQGALAELVAHATSQKAMPVLGLATKSREATSSKPDADAQTLRFFQRTWSRLSADQRLAQSRASLPENAGPLNSHHLVHRSLTLMHELSPEYLERFVGYIDALQWVEQANEAAAQEAAGGARSAGAKKAMAARR